jgi:hypothetical protein
VVPADPSPRPILVKDEADHSPALRVEVKNNCSYPSAVCLTGTFMNSYTIYIPHIKEMCTIRTYFV